MRKLLFLLLASGSIAAVAQKPVKSVPKPKATSVNLTKPVRDLVNPLKNLKDSASYALGINIGRNLKAQIGDVNMDLLLKGLKDIYANKATLLPDEAANNCIGSYQQQSQTEKASVNKVAGKAFLTANAKKPGVVTLPSGLQYQVLKDSADTAKPTLNDKVKCHYHGTLLDGTVFDSSVDRGEPLSFPLNGVIKGWQEALQLMTVGSKWKLFIPSDLAYGDNAAGPKIGAGSTLIFEVELLGIEK
ncbi:MAG: FKBP-type peptidyl-prolyl cis-trans isomerase [Chitinophagaceae bacterium]